MDLSQRVSDYFKKSYLKTQSVRGSAISAAILKHGLSYFSLQILVLGESPLRNTISVNSDFILLEQKYLNSYTLIYNIRRLALGTAPVLNPNYKYNKGDTNSLAPSPYGSVGAGREFLRGKAGTKAAAPFMGGGQAQSLEQKNLWSESRSTPIFIYDYTTLTLNSIVYGYEKLANLLGIHYNTARRFCKSSGVYNNKYILSLSELDKEHILTIKNSIKVKSTTVKVVHVYNKNKSVLLKTFPSVNAFMLFSKQNGSSIKLFCTTDTLWLNEYFLSYDLIASADNSLLNVSEFKPILKNRKTSIPVYTYSANGAIYIKRYSSLRECVKELDGNRNTNTNTLELRIKHKELYKGFRVSNTPLFDHND